MQIILDVLAYIFFHLFFEIVCYSIGRFVAPILFNGIKVESVSRIRTQSNRWKWKGFTYEQSKQRFFYAESLQMIGLLSILVVAIPVILLMVKYI